MVDMATTETITIGQLLPWKPENATQRAALEVFGATLELLVRALPEGSFTLTAPRVGPLPPTIRRGEGIAGVVVVEWQQILNKHYCGDNLSEAGFGPKTEQWTRALQRELGLKVDGIVGPRTWAAALRLEPAELHFRWGEDGLVVEVDASVGYRGDVADFFAGGLERAIASLFAARRGAA